MTRVLYVDCVAGVAGDMLLGALLDAGADRRIGAGLAGLGVEGLELRTERVSRHAISATHATIHAAPGQPQRDWRSIRTLIDAAELPERARDRAQEAFRRLAARRGADPRRRPGAGALPRGRRRRRDRRGVRRRPRAGGPARRARRCSPLPVGRGFVEAAHGRLPLPAPATLELLEGAPLYGVEVETELVTPTGAALVAALAAGYGPLPSADARDRRLRRRHPRRRRAARTSCGRSSASRPAPASRPVSLIEANLDDLLPELAPDAAAACFAAGALDVWTAPAQMKNGRPGFVLSALARPGEEQAVATAMLRETSTLGVRIARLDRIELERESRTVEVAGEPVRVRSAGSTARSSTWRPSTPTASVPRGAAARR